ncbi:electron transfer flavoprotein subunit beta/FixA family protein [Arthrobacter caoxuetaonis]|uniref:electron transfer flavoprotein subunit beta/FixA family protein n=1 Tax=Arthrobacter caoxuetaonis TaxID=2886935 RepID=UPI001D13C104|nr:electron transfer flavoprotein subunit beta/FixA family protein [Arthrobacter caoxuetaonis]MCC3281986.1 electron transfer flavoprotein subunit beta/FixA family protein [Arthrobacter caoxuetaonis]MCC3282975.1 electron transfer flavoprotein subunit beta/FixA family protein [Arthrobacter caoxuetaonis]
MKIVVLAKQVPDTWSDRKIDLATGNLDRAASEPVPDEINERALESALRYKDVQGGTDIVVLSMGPEDAPKTLRKLLSMGADSAVLITDPELAGSDMVQTARVLAAAVNRLGADLVIAGNEATDGRAGIVPAMVAEILGWPVLPNLDEVHIAEDSVQGVSQIDGGTLTISAPLPAAVSVTERSAEARFPNFKGIMAAKKKPLESWSLADLGLSGGSAAAPARSVMVSANARPPKQAGPKIIDDGTAAARLAEFLVTNRLV